MIDARGIPTHACPECGSVWLKIAAQFEDGEVVAFGLDAECYECGTLVTAPTPLDKVE